MAEIERHLEDCASEDGASPVSEPFAPVEPPEVVPRRRWPWWLAGVICVALLAGAGVLFSNGMDAYRAADDTRSSEEAALSELATLEARLEELNSTRADVEAAIARLADNRLTAEDRTAAAREARVAVEAAIAAIDAGAASLDATVVALYEDIGATSLADIRVDDALAGAVSLGNRRDVDGMNDSLAGNAANALAAFESSVSAAREAVQEAELLLAESGGSS